MGYIRHYRVLPWAMGPLTSLQSRSLKYQTGKSLKRVGNIGWGSANTAAHLMAPIRSLSQGLHNYVASSPGYSQILSSSRGEMSYRK